MILAEFQQPRSGGKNVAQGVNPGSKTGTAETEPQRGPKESAPKPHPNQLAGSGRSCK